MRNLDGKTAVITGSDSGIGKAIAEILAEAGARIAITYHTDRAGAQETLNAIRQAGSKGILFQLDVRKESSVKALFEGVSERLGVPDILVNNAASDFEKALRSARYCAGRQRGADENVSPQPRVFWRTACGVSLHAGSRG